MSAIITDINTRRVVPTVEIIQEEYRPPAGVIITDLGTVPEYTRKDIHAAEPIKNRADIEAIQRHLIRNGRYRDNLLFTMGINVGLRCGDLRWIRVCGILTEDGTAFRDECHVVEEKTGKRRYFCINDEVKAAFNLWLEHEGTVSMNDLLFKGTGNRSKSYQEEGRDAPMQVRSIERLLKTIINDECGLTVHASTHCLRKTFAYHMIQNAPERARAIEFLQKLFGHSSPAITLRYAGITEDEERNAYLTLNLGCLSHRQPDGDQFPTSTIKKENVS